MREWGKLSGRASWGYSIRPRLNPSKRLFQGELFSKLQVQFGIPRDALVSSLEEKGGGIGEKMFGTLAEMGVSVLGFSFMTVDAAEPHGLSCERDAPREMEGY